MLNFYEKKGRKIFIAVVIAIIVGISVVFIVTKFDSYNNDISQIEQTEKTIEKMTDVVEVVSYNGQMEYIEGEVEKRSGKNDGWRSVQKSDVIKNGDEIRTLADSRAIITFEDGSAVRLDENTVIVFDGSKENISIDMQKGFVYNKVAKNEDRKYIVTTGDYSVTALGTEFSVSNEDDQIDVMVIESAVDVKNGKEELIDKVQEGNKAIVKDNKIQKKEIEKGDLEEEFVAWNISKSDNEKVAKLETKKEVKKEEKKEKEKKAKKDEVAKGTIKLTGTKSSSGVRLHWETAGVNTGHGFKVVKSKEVNPIYPGSDYKYLSDSGVRDYKWKIDTGKKYHFRVCAYLGDGKCGVYSNDVYVDTPDGDDDDKDDDSDEGNDYASKVSLSGSKDGDNVKLKWDISGGGAPKGFKVVKSKSKNPVYPGDDYKYLSNGDTTKYTWKDLSDDKTYYFRVCIYKGSKCGTYSNNVKIEM